MPEVFNVCLRSLANHLGMQIDETIKGAVDDGPATITSEDRDRGPIGEVRAKPGSLDSGLTIAAAALPDGIALLSPVRAESGRTVDFTWQAANPAAERMIGRTGLAGSRLSADPAGRVLLPGLMAALDAQEADPWFAAVTQSDGSVRRWRIATGRTADGLSLSLGDAGPADGEDRATARVLAAMDAARREAERSNRAKSQFLAQMSHELRTPLNAVLGFSELLLSETFGPLGNPRYLEYAADIRDSGSHLLSLINDILDLSRIETGQMVLAEEAVDVGAAVAQALRMIAPRAAQAGVRLSGDVPDDLPYLMGDQRAMLQMLLNLLGNAVKFTPENGEAMVSAMLLPDGGVGLMVADTGSGIPESELDRILKPFERADTPDVRRTEGTGLGLPIVKRLAERHGGRLELTSEAEVGTTAILIFPARRSLPRTLCPPLPHP